MKLVKTLYTCSGDGLTKPIILDTMADGKLWWWFDSRKNDDFENLHSKKRRLMSTNEQ